MKRGVDLEQPLLQAPESVDDGLEGVQAATDLEAPRGDTRLLREVCSSSGGSSSGIDSSRPAYVASPHHSVLNGSERRGSLKRVSKPELPQEEQQEGAEPQQKQQALSSSKSGREQVVCASSQHNSKDGVLMYESFDFIEPNSLVRQIALRKKRPEERRREHVWRWVLIFLIATCTAVIALSIGAASEALQNVKFAVVSAFLEKGAVLSGFGAFFGMNLALVLCASTLVAYVEPVAAGSGIPEIKCILNGLKIPRAVRVKTLFCKALGVTAGVAAGLPIGKEGPMIHAGAVCGAGLSQGKSTTAGLDTRWSLFRPFRNDREKRDFIASGAAAGVACAFGAPLGGVLFALEEGASFWNQLLTLQTFCCAMAAAFILDVLTRTVRLSNDPGAMFQFGSFNAFGQDTVAYRLTEVPSFLIMGAIGGLLGALYNSMNLHISKFRALLVSICVSLVAFFVPYLMRSDCSNVPSQGSLVHSLRPFACQAGQYSGSAILFFNPAELAIKYLFHSSISFNIPTLLIFMSLYYLLSCWTYGLSIPSGLFVPNLLAGAAFGRLVGQLLEDFTPLDVVDPGTYALIGAAALLGGMARMTISLTVILLEATGDIQYGLPIMLTLITSKWVGDIFNEGLYDMHIELRGFQFLHWHAPAIADFFLTMDVMSTEVEVLPDVVRVRDVYELLVRCRHAGFPVVSSRSLKKRSLRGFILRKHLCVLLQHCCFHLERPIPYETAPSIEYSVFQKCYPRFPVVKGIHILPRYMDMWLDLTPYMCPSPHSIQEHAPASHAFELFRTMGLRHLCVVNKENEIVGLVTRQDFSDLSLKKRLDGLLGSGSSVDHPESARPSHTVERSVSSFAFVRDLDSAPEA